MQPNQEESSSFVSTESPPTNLNALVCPHCGSNIIVRLKRAWHQKVLNSQKHYYCRSCKTAFWDKR